MADRRNQIVRLISIDIIHIALCQAGMTQWRAHTVGDAPVGFSVPLTYTDLVHLPSYAYRSVMVIVHDKRH